LQLNKAMDKTAPSKESIVMKGNDFIQVSMRGRIALILCTLEQAVQYEQFDQATWQFVIDRLWNLLENKFVEDFSLEMLSISPYFVSESSDFNHYMGVYDDDEPPLDAVSEDEFNDLKAIYEPENICAYFVDMIECFSEMGYSVAVPDDICVEKIDECIAYIEVRGLSLPPLEKFQMAVRGGFAEWGSNIIRAMFFDKE
jgi:hypothetical protein